jgi:hypothetical protein
VGDRQNPRLGREAGREAAQVGLEVLPEAVVVAFAGLLQERTRAHLATAGQQVGIEDLDIDAERSQPRHVARSQQHLHAAVGEHPVRVIQRRHGATLGGVAWCTDPTELDRGGVGRDPGAAIEDPDGGGGCHDPHRGGRVAQSLQQLTAVESWHAGSP